MHDPDQGLVILPPVRAGHVLAPLVGHQRQPVLVGDLLGPADRRDGGGQRDLLQIFERLLGVPPSILAMSILVLGPTFIDM